MSKSSSSPFHFSSPDAETLFTEIIRGFVWETLPGMQSQYSANDGRAWINDVELEITHPLSKKFNLCLSGYHFPNRWNKFFTEYTQAAPFAEFLGKCRLLQPTQISGYTCATRSHHNLGNCLHAVNYRAPGANQLPQVTLYGRSSLFSPVGVLDIGFGLAVVEWIAKNSRQRIKQENFRLVWRTSQIQVMSWKLLLSLRLLNIIEKPEDLPDTNMGRLLRMHIEDSYRGIFPTLRMFARQGHKYIEMEEKGYFNNPKVFYPEIPLSHTPEFVGKRTADEFVDYEVDAVEWLEDMSSI